MTTSIQPGRILTDLSHLWDRLDQEQSGTNGDGTAGGVLRACAMTLVVTANSDSDAEQVRRHVGVLMHDHPSRALILKIRDGAEAHASNPDAHVFAECWKPFGASQPVCAEGVEISFDSAAMEEAAQVMVPLKAADLPAVLWCRGPAVFQYRSYDLLFPVADKIIVDSSTVPHAAAALAFLRGLRSRGYRVGDLHWTRLTGWREVLSHLFDDTAECAPGDNSRLRPSDITSVRLVYGGARPATCALYFASWIEAAAPRARVSLVSQEDSPAGLRSVTIESAANHLTLTREGSVIHVSGCGRDYRTALPPADEESLMREELRFLGSDPVFERVLS